MENLSELAQMIYAAAFVRSLDEKRLRAGSRERRATAAQAHEFAIAAVEAFTMATDGSR